MAEDQAAGAAAAGLAGQGRPGDDNALQALPAHPSDSHASRQPSLAAVASQQPSWQQYNSVFTASKAGACSLQKADNTIPQHAQLADYVLLLLLLLLLHRHARCGQGEGERTATCV
jgi:hypothetical protein